VEVSEAYAEELVQKPDLEILEGPYPMVFDSSGNLPALLLHQARKKDPID
jgi:hypothetical protein